MATLATYNQVAQPTYKTGQPVIPGQRIKYMGVNGTVTNVKSSGNVSLKLNEPVLNNKTGNMSNVATVKYVNVERMITKPIGKMVNNTNLSLGGKERSILYAAQQLAAQKNANAKALQNAANAKQMELNPQNIGKGNKVRRTGAWGIRSHTHEVNEYNPNNGTLTYVNLKNGKRRNAKNFSKV